jgi:hypothetical protein
MEFLVSDYFVWCAKKNNAHFVFAKQDLDYVYIDMMTKTKKFIKRICVPKWRMGHLHRRTLLQWCVRQWKRR